VYAKTRPKAPEKIKRAANLPSSQKISISRTCEMKLGYISRKEKHFTSMNRIVSVSLMQISDIFHEILIFKQGEVKKRNKAL